MKTNSCVRVLHLLFALSVCFAAETYAGSATWSSNPISTDWNTAANWDPATVPNSLTDVATFDTSAITTVTVDTPLPYDYVATMHFTSGADSFTITTSTINAGLVFVGDGIVNDSGKTQKFVATNNGQFAFFDSASCGTDTDFSILGGSMTFDEEGSPGSAHFTVSDSTGVGGSVSFFGSSGASTGTPSFDIGLNGEVYSDTTPFNCPFNVKGGTLRVEGSSSLETSTIDCDQGGEIVIYTYGTVPFGSPRFTIHGSPSKGATRNTVVVVASPLDQAKFNVEGGTAQGALGGIIYLGFDSTLGGGSVTLGGGTSGGKGANLVFNDASTGGKATIDMSGNALINLSRHRPVDPVDIGSLSGTGTVYLGLTSLYVGGNNRSTRFSGVIQDFEDRTGGPLAKVGNGTFALDGANTYTGRTFVNEGTLGGSGSIQGALTVGTGEESGATFAPAAGTGKATTFTVNRDVTFKSDGTYSCLVAGSGDKPSSDQLAARGVTISSGAQFVLDNAVRGAIRLGKIFTVLNNVAHTPINGTFANLPDGATLTMGSNTFQANYEGGDGNDLTLTVVQ